MRIGALEGVVHTSSPISYKQAAAMGGQARPKLDDGRAASISNEPRVEKSDLKRAIGPHKQQ